MKKSALFILTLCALAAFAQNSFFDTMDANTGLFSGMDTGDSGASDDPFGAQTDPGADDGASRDAYVGADSDAGAAESAEPSPFDRKPLLERAGTSTGSGKSFGANVFWSGDFGGGAKYTGTGVYDYDSYVTPVYGMGIQPFFDAEYVEASLSLFWGGGTWARQKDGNTLTGFGYKKDASIFSLNVDALGKYPVPINDNITAFPLAGLAYHITLWGQRGTNDQGREAFDGQRGNPKAIEFSALWFKFGGGFDYALTERVYVRSALIYGIRLANSYENNVLAKDDLVPGGKPRLGHGLTIRAGVGLNM